MNTVFNKNKFLLKCCLLVFYLVISNYAVANEFSRIPNDSYIIVSPVEAKWVKGIEFKVIQAYKNIGIDAEIMHLPAKRSLLEALHSGWVDAELGRVADAQEFLTSYLKVPVPLFYADVVAVSTQQGLNLTGWHQLKMHQVITLRGMIGITNRLEKHDIDFQQSTSLNQIYKMLASQRADVAILPSAFATKEVLADSVNSTEFTINKIDQEPIYHFVHQRHKQLIPKLTKSLTSLLDNQLSKNGS